MGGALCRRCVGVPRWGFVCGAANFMPEFYSSAEIFPYLCAGVSPGANLPESFCKTPLTESRRRCRITCKSRLLKPSLGGWLSGRALRSHRRGHWFESSTAHRLLRFRSHTDDFVRVSLPFFLPGKGYQVNNSPLRLQKTAEASLPLSDLQKYMDGWLLSCEISQHSAATLANQRLILKNLI